MGKKQHSLDIKMAELVIASIVGAIVATYLSGFEYMKAEVLTDYIKKGDYSWVLSPAIINATLTATLLVLVFSIGFYFADWLAKYVDVFFKPAFLIVQMVFGLLSKIDLMIIKKRKTKGGMKSNKKPASPKSRYGRFFSLLLSSYLFFWMNPTKTGIFIRFYMLWVVIISVLEFLENRDIVFSYINQNTD